MINKLTADELRSRYLRFFEARGHVVVPSASLIPDRDPSVLFTTAGMHPLVPYFFGQPHPAGTRIVDCQKCVRTNDIEEVGDPTHLTFFEMLGNWSFGDYFKKESITWSYEFLTHPDCLGLDSKDIWVTVFAGNDATPRDDESKEIWESLGIDPEQIIFLDEEHNWWAVGPEGPCGPDTEIFIDLVGHPCDNESAEECLPGLCKNSRFFEIWNNVFMTFERTDGQLYPLPKKNVDTGMGLERTLAVLNGVPTVYETSSFAPIIAELTARSSYDPKEIEADPKLTKALRIIADHLRTSVFILGDQNEVSPSNQGQGYVLRRLIRRSVRFAQQLGVKPTDWVSAAQSVIDVYADPYPELAQHWERIFTELATEQERFERTLDRGTARLNRELQALAESGQTTLPGEAAFHLYDTYGFPIEFTEEMAAELGFSVDVAGYERYFAEHRERSRSAAAASGLADDSEESVRYHTATHLTHAALRKVLGDHVFQKGSNITSERMRFDFSHPKAMTKDEIGQVEDLVNKWVAEEIPVQRELMPQEQARAEGAIGLFDDKYQGTVSVYRIGDRSFEFCGGPHVSNTKEIGRFHITKEQSCGAGLRRIRAVIN
ncbi:MAG: alanine--tRNA ligase [Isosphaeraceae bacterium]